MTSREYVTIINKKYGLPIQDNYNVFIDNYVEIVSV